MMQMDPHRIRQDFPVFQREIGGRPIAFFDGPAGSQVPRQVADAVAGYLTLHNANTLGHFATSNETDAILAGARVAMADFVGGDADEIVFGANMTTLTLHLSRSLGRAWAEGDEVIVTALDHQANVAPWRLMAEDAGMTVRVVPFDPETLQLDYGALESLLSSRTRLLAIGAASNAVGTINDVRRAAEMARAAGALTFVDAVHYAPHRLVDVRGAGVRLPGLLRLQVLRPARRRPLGAARAAGGVPALSPAARARPGRPGAGRRGRRTTRPSPGSRPRWSGSPRSRARARGAGARRCGAPSRRCTSTSPTSSAAWKTGCAPSPACASTAPRAAARARPTAAFTVEGVSPDEVARRLGREGVFVGDGDFYATTVCDTLGLSDCGGLVRAGIAPYTTEDDVGRLIEGVGWIAAGS